MIKMLWLSLACVLLVVSGPAAADEVVVMISGGFRSSYDALLPAFTEATGHTARTLQSPSMGDTPEAIPNRLKRGEDDDVLIMVGPALDGLVKTGLARADTRTDLALSSIGLAVKAGAAVPDVSTPDKLRDALLAAKSIAYSDSASGVYVRTTLFKTLGIEDAMKTKAHMIPGAPVGEIVARGEADIGFQQVAELLPVKGITFVGKIPESLQLVTTYSAAVATHSKHPDAAAALIRFLARPAATPILEKMGLDAPQH